MAAKNALNKTTRKAIADAVGAGMSQLRSEIAAAAEAVKALIPAPKPAKRGKKGKHGKADAETKKGLLERWGM